MRIPFVGAALLLLTFVAAMVLGSDAPSPRATHAAQIIGANSCGGDGNPDCPSLPDNYEIGSNSCNGTGACASLKDGVVIGNNSCNGQGACSQAGGSIGSGSCIGPIACHLNGDGGTGIIGNDSCHGVFACDNNGLGGTGIIGVNSCHGNTVCVDNGRDVSGQIGNNACHNEDELCRDNVGVIGDCTRNDPELPVCMGTLEVRKLLLPLTDAGRFNLLIDGETFAANVRSGGSTGAVPVSQGARTVSETAVSGTSLANYNATIVCTEDRRIVAAGSGTSLTVSVAPGDDVVCTILNTRARGTQRWR